MSRATTSTYDVIVIGLGAVGSAALCHAAQSGARVLGIDRFYPPHEFGSTHGETRITRQAIGEGAQFVPLVLRANTLWRELEAATGETLFTQNGGLILLDDPKVPGFGTDFFRQTIDAARRFSIPHELLSSAEVSTRFPQFISSNNGVAYHEPGAGFLYAEKCVAAHLELARRNGAVIHGGELVTEIVTNSGGVMVRTEKTDYSASSIIFCPGPWMPRWSQQICGLSPANFEVYRQTLYWLALEKPQPSFSPAHMPVFIWNSAQEEKSFYGFPSLDGISLKIATEQFLSSTDADAPAAEVDQRQIHSFYRQFVQPRLPGVTERAIKTVTCFYTHTPDASFVIDHAVDSDRLWFASACSGHGFKHSPAVGETLARKALGMEALLDLSPFERGRLLPA